jgi:predicted DNA-binding antitoxin AbrB/MazE fold protein
MTVEAIFENGNFRPLKPVSFAAGQKVRLEVEPVPNPSKDDEHDALYLLTHMLDGMTEQEKDEFIKEINTRRPMFRDEIVK